MPPPPGALRERGVLWVDLRPVLELPAAQRGAVFFLCSGALLLPPGKEVTVRRVWTKYIPAILAARFSGPQPMRVWSCCRAGALPGVLERTALRQAALNLVLFHHKNHLYYLHIILLVYAVLPLTRRLVAAADRRLLNYALGIWFVLGCLAPTLKFFPPLVPRRQASLPSTPST